jgi:signal transduction histidine kinase
MDAAMAEVQADPRMAQAFEQGRSTERTRLAQDLHDDIGARLLTLIVRARDPALADALRETLRDLKALTRGLSAPRVRLSEAAADWQADAAARLAEADITLDWRLDTGADAALDAVQWQALTRVLRELLSNAIAHAKPDVLRLRGALHDGWLSLAVEDDGDGRQPERWAAGLGLSGVRRRVRELGGTVQWQERVPCGIRCTLRVPLAPPPSPPGSAT